MVRTSTTYEKQKTWKMSKIWKFVGQENYWLKFSVEYPGWDVGLLYKRAAPVSFVQMFLHLTLPASDFLVDEKTDQYDVSFVNQSFHDNLYKTSRVMIVVYDQRNDAKEELIFQGAEDLWKWFDAWSVRQERSNLMKITDWCIKSNYVGSEN